MFRLFNFLILALLLISCGNIKEKFGRLSKPSLTKVYFSKPKYFNNKLGTMATLPGGVMVYGIDLDDPYKHGAKQLDNEDDETEWVIPSGNYQFLAVGYANANMIGPMYCGISDTVELFGQPEVVFIAMDQTKCGGPPFVRPGWGSAGQPLDFYFASCSASTLGVTAPSPCSGTGPIELQISLPEYDAWDGSIHVAENNAGGIDSACTGGSEGTPLLYSNVKIPTGDTSPYDPFVLGIDFHIGSTSCTNSHKLVGFGRGLTAFNDMSKVFFFPNGGAGIPVPPIPGSQMTSLQLNGANLFFYFHDSF